MQSIAAIVEGQSEVESIPIIFRRILQDMGVHDVQIARPFRVKRNKIVKEGELEKAIRQVIRDRENVRAIAVILDADDDCPAKLGESLLERGKKAADLPIAVVIANRELEGWFLGAKESLRGVRGISDNATAPDNPESIRDAKGKLEENMEIENIYTEVDDQPAFSQQFDFSQAGRNCPSFDKLIRDVGCLVQEIKKDI